MHLSNGLIRFFLQNEQEALDYEDTVLDDNIEGMTDTDQSFSEVTTQIKTESMPVEVGILCFV